MQKLKKEMKLSAITTGIKVFPKTCSQIFFCDINFVKNKSYHNFEHIVVTVHKMVVQSIGLFKRRREGGRLRGRSSQTLL